MAQARRKRRTKHRGNAAGTIEARGRTGRPPTKEERKKQTREQARIERMSQPPTWTSSFKRALLAAGFMMIFLLVTSKGNFAAAFVFSLFALALYVPAGYYLELYMYRRRIRKGTIKVK